MIVLVLGGTRSGKSAVAERIATDLGGPVTYIATARCEPGDTEFAARIAEHRRRRPATWRTIEEPGAVAGALAGVLGGVTGTAVVESLGTWIANAPHLAPDVAGLCAALRAFTGDVIVVSEEVGLAPLPIDPVARRFVDALGECNAAVARIADRAVLVVAGRTLELGPG